MKHSEYSRIRVQVLHELGHSMRQIKAETGRPINFIQRWIGRQNVQRQEGTGKTVKITRGIVHQIFKRMAMKKRMSTRVLARKMNLSQTSILRTAKRIGLFPYRTQKKPLLTSEMVSDRMKFAKKILNHDWSQTLFIDEKKVCLVQEPNRKNDVIWAPKGETIPYVPTIKFPFHFNVCAGISVTGRTEIFIFEENMDSELFLKILRESIIPGAKKLFNNKWELFMDNDPKHRAKKAEQFLHENQIICPKIPARSPDLNPIENVWSMMDDELKQISHQTKNSLRKAIKSAWKKIDQNKIKNAIESMPSRLRLIKEAKGLHIS